MPHAALEFPEIEIRLFHEADLDAVVAIDRAIVGRDRRAYLGRYAWSPEKGERISLSLVAAAGGEVAGYVLGGVYRGEFGAVEPLAILETIGVRPGARRQRVAHTLFAAFAEHARRLDASHIRTLVPWNAYALLGFFEAMGMRPTGLVPLSVNVDKVPPVPPHEVDDD